MKPVPKNLLKMKITMTSLYIFVGIAFVLITTMNLYSWKVVSKIGKDFSAIGECSIEFRDKFAKAFEHLQKACLSDSIQERQRVESCLKEASEKADEIKKRLTKVNLTEHIKRFRQNAESSYGLSKKERQNKIDLCKKEVTYAHKILENFESERSSLMKNEMAFISFTYAVLLIGNLIAFSAIFIVVFINDHNIKAKEKKLNSDNANFHAVMQGIDSILITTDLKGIIQSWNSNAERYFDLSDAHVIGHSLYEVVPAFQAYKEFFEKVCYSKKRYYKFHENMHMNKGPLRIVDMLCVPIIPKGSQKNDVQLLLKLDDVTTFATEEKYHFRSRCADIVSTAMKNVVQDFTVRNSRVTYLLDELNQYASSNGIDLSAYIATISNSFSEISMIPQKYSVTVANQKLSNIQMNLNELIMYVLRICLKVFPGSINLEVSLNESKSWILADPSALSTALFCLMNNACEAIVEMGSEHAEKGGIISISVEKIAGEKIVCDKVMRFRSAVKEAPYWVVMITDNGAGIKPEDLESIYDPFFTTKDPSKHKGLGLSVAINIINSLGGYMDVSAIPGKGSVFKFYLPDLELTDTEAGETNQNLNADEPDIVKGHGMLLLLDDDLFMQQITRSLLNKLGYSVLATPNGYEAIELYGQDCSAEHPAIQTVLVNLGTDGFFSVENIIENLRQINPDVKIVVFTKSGNGEEVQTLQAAGIQDFIAKPYSVTELSKTLAKYVPDEAAS